MKPNWIPPWHCPLSNLIHDERNNWTFVVIVRCRETISSHRISIHRSMDLWDTQRLFIMCSRVEAIRHLHWPSCLGEREGQGAGLWASQPPLGSASVRLYCSLLSAQGGAGGWGPVPGDGQSVSWSLWGSGWPIGLQTRYHHGRPVKIGDPVTDHLICGGLDFKIKFPWCVYLI